MASIGGVLGIIGDMRVAKSSRLPQRMASRVAHRMLNKDLRKVLK